MILSYRSITLFFAALIFLAGCGGGGSSSSPQEPPTNRSPSITDPGALSLTEGGTEVVTLSVSDEGPGIGVEARDKIFDRFHSDRPEAEDFGNHSGLGLAIARTIAEAHDGSLEAVDRPDGKPGACLLLTLPNPRKGRD